MSWLSPAAKAALANNPERREWLEKNPPPFLKPKPMRAIAVPVSDQVAEAAKANPDSVRVAARDARGNHVVSGPRVRGVDGVTSAVGWMGWGKRGELSNSGMWFEPEASGAGAVSNYDPMKRFEREER